jgi:hypothetical protein
MPSFVSSLFSQFSFHKSRRMRRRSSTAPRVFRVTTPNLWTSRSLDTDRMSSHFTKLRLVNPPSGDLISTCKGMPFSLVVMGITTTSPAGPWLNRSTETTRPGLLPACSCPRVGFKSISQISPRRGLSILNHPLDRQSG